MTLNEHYSYRCVCGKNKGDWAIHSNPNDRKSSLAAMKKFEEKYKDKFQE